MNAGTGLLAGTASGVITPPVGVDLSGYAAREGPSLGVHDDLRGEALFVANGGNRALIVTADLIGFSAAEAAEIREDIAARCGISVGDILVCCTHTHSGPVTRCLRGLGAAQDSVLLGIRRRLVDIACRAVGTARPAAAGWGKADVAVGVNRREARDGGMVIGVNPGGPTVPYADILKVEDASGGLLAVLFCHPAHAVALGSDNRLISADWPGAAKRHLESMVGEGAVALFMQGCCGNINCRLRTGFEQVDALGLEMARAVAGALPGIAAERTGPVLCGGTRVHLPLADPPALPEAESACAAFRAEASAARASGNPGRVVLADAMVEWSEEILRLAAAGATGRHLPCEIRALRIGDGVVVGLPGEFFCEYALGIAARSPFTRTAVAGYTNGNIGYVPTAAAYAEGGYEVDHAVRYYGTTMLAPACEAILVDACLKVLSGLVA